MVLDDVTFEALLLLVVEVGIDLSLAANVIRYANDHSVSSRRLLTLVLVVASVVSAAVE